MCVMHGQNPPRKETMRRDSMHRGSILRCIYVAVKLSGNIAVHVIFLICDIGEARLFNSIETLGLEKKY